MMGGGLGLKNIQIWVKLMCGEFGEFTGIIGLVIDILVFGTTFLSVCDTSTWNDIDNELNIDKEIWQILTLNDIVRNTNGEKKFWY